MTSVVVHWGKNIEKKATNVSSHSRGIGVKSECTKCIYLPHSQPYTTQPHQCCNRGRHMCRRRRLGKKSIFLSHTFTNVGKWGYTEIIVAQWGKRYVSQTI